ncbi:MAG: flagellar basal-body rod protein FlgC [Gemmatimonadetes bacterium]|jgi:flagellar basal-body rod protein FlgC|nr:flagellar basal-body rod protein FlgC [Gemmatimonadota bacterium]
MPPISRPLGLLPLPNQQPVRPMFRSLAISASGLSAQRQRMEVIANNLANAETTRTDAGTPYKRRVTSLESATGATQQFGAAVPGLNTGNIPNPVMPFGSQAFEVPALVDAPQSFTVPALPGSGDDGLHGVRVASVTEDTTEGPLVYDPGHPDADERGYVRYPNVRVTDEMINLMDARRVYEANATVFQSAKAMLKKALEI